MKPILGITIGDPAGVGPEVSVKACVDAGVRNICRPLLIAGRPILENALHICDIAAVLRRIDAPSELADAPETLDYIEVETGVDTPPTAGTLSAVAGEAAFQYILTAIRLALAGDIHGVVTAPINKEALHLAGHRYSGHTEIFSQYTDTRRYAMLLASESLRVIHVTTHVALRRACEMITADRVHETIVLGSEALRSMGVAGKIAVAGLNPHSSENGLFGDEETSAIIPAIARAQGEGIDVIGPEPPDTVFVKALSGEYAMVVAMYHDQGHIPFKLAGFHVDNNGVTSVRGVNCTLGLPIIRTSVDHGTAFDKAGKNTADAGSMIDALRMAAAMAKTKFGL